ncbi:hypothetical protein C5S32_06835 [ANME-1 cluster archaeon GoMg1]|nr:hypothetical protein [ANME-1 cluster archaeon GoMg1]
MSYQHFQVVKKYSSETLFNFIKANIVKDYGIKPKGVISFLKANPKAISKQVNGRIPKIRKMLLGLIKHLRGKNG